MRYCIDCHCSYALPTDVLCAGCTDKFHDSVKFHPFGMLAGVLGTAAINIGYYALAALSSPIWLTALFATKARRR